MREAARVYAQVRLVPDLLSGACCDRSSAGHKKVELVREMTVSDPIADMLTRIRNAIMADHDSVLVPSSKIKLAIAKVLKDEGFIHRYEVIKEEPQPMIDVHLKYVDGKAAILGLERISKPGLKVYAERREIPRVYGGLGIAVLSTSKGIMTGQQAWKNRVGGEILCYVW